MRRSQGPTCGPRGESSRRPPNLYGASCLRGAYYRDGWRQSKENRALPACGGAPDGRPVRSGPRSQRRPALSGRQHA
eukprot:5888759-Heterocapsa_arctica.AAC.1